MEGGLEQRLPPPNKFGGWDIAKSAQADCHRSYSAPCHFEHIRSAQCNLREKYRCRQMEISPRKRFAARRNDSTQSIHLSLVLTADF